MSSKITNQSNFSIFSAVKTMAKKAVQPMRFLARGAVDIALKVPVLSTVVAGTISATNIAKSNLSLKSKVIMLLMIGSFVGTTSALAVMENQYLRGPLTGIKIPMVDDVDDCQGSRPFDQLRIYANEYPMTNDRLSSVFMLEKCRKLNLEYARCMSDVIVQQPITAYSSPTCDYIITAHEIANHKGLLSGRIPSCTCSNIAYPICSTFVMKDSSMDYLREIGNDFGGTIFRR